MSRRATVGLGALVWLGLALCQATPARADYLAVSADVPVTFDLHTKANGASASNSAGSVSGLKLSLSLPFLVGLGYENYEGAFPAKSGNSSFHYSVMMYDVFINPPIPLVNLSLGVGVGSGTVSAPGVTQSDAPLTQYFLSAGFDIVPLVDVHLGYHVFNGTNKITSPGSFNEEVDGQMVSLGVKVGF